MRSQGISTPREELDANDFDWTTGQIIYRGFLRDQDGRINRYSSSSPPARVLGHDAPELDEEFSTDFGASEFPPMVAFDAKRIYVIHCYDGATGLETVERDPEAYLSGGVEPPCIGGY